MSELILSLLLFASQETGYPIPTDIQPQIIYASHSYVVREFCGGVDNPFQPCNIVGMYLMGEHKIYIDITVVQGETKNSFIVHELTHFLQDVNHSHEGTSCSQARLREDEAYRVENVYGLMHGVEYNEPASDDEIICDHTKI